MSTIEYFKLQAKNLMRDWNTHQDNDELGYVYTPRFFDVGDLLEYFEENESEFCLQRAQHLIAKLAGFKKWDELIHSNEDELRFAKTVFVGQKASNNLISAYVEWQDYYYSNGIDHLDIRNKTYVAQRYFSLPVDEEFKKENPTQDLLDQFYKKLKPFVEPVEAIAELLYPTYKKIEVLTESSKLIPEKIKNSISECLNSVNKQIHAMDDIRQEYFEGIDRIIESWGSKSKLSETLAEALEKKSIAQFRNSVTSLIPEVINGFTALKHDIEPDSEIVSILREDFDSIIEHENTIRNQMKMIIDKHFER